MKDRDEIIKAAHKYAQKGQINDAIAEYLKILPYSMDGNIRNVIGDLYLKKDSADEAIKYFREAAVIFNKDESHTKAIALYHKILSIDPDQLDVVIELAELNAERGFIKQAVEDLIKAAEAYNSKSLPIKALGIYKKALAVSPSDINLMLKIADIHLETNHIDNAIKMYLAIAMEHDKNAEPVKAEIMYKKVIGMEPDNIESLTHLSRLAEDDQDLELAFEYMSRAAFLAPDNSKIMFDYSSLAAKANKDISEYLLQVADGPDNKKTQHLQLPDTVNNCDITGNAHGSLDLSPENSNTEHLKSGEPISTSTSPLSMTSTGYVSEEADYTHPHDTNEIPGYQNEIEGESIHYENTSSHIYNSVLGEASKTVTSQEAAEIESDQNIEEHEFSLSVKETHEKSEKDSRRLKRRVKSNRLQVALIFFLTIVTAVSFFVTYKFINKSQTVDVETPVYSIPREPQTITEVKDKGSSSDTSKISALDQEVLNLPVRETEPVINDIKTNADNTDELTLNGEEINLSDIQEEVSKSTIKHASEIVKEKENTNIASDTLTVPEKTNIIQLEDHKKENTSIDSETPTVPVTTDKMQQEDHEKEQIALISFNEPFDNNNNNWDIVETSTAHVRLKDGKYYILNMRESGAYVILNGPDISTDSEFEIESHLISLDATDEHSYGLVFGAKNKEDYFVFQMLPEDYYSIRKYFRGASLELAGGNINNKPESQDLFNVLKINNKENKLSFFINGNFIDEVSDISFSNRKAGFFVDGQAEIVIDNIRIN